jgi:hypothetical protein
MMRIIVGGILIAAAPGYRYPLVINCIGLVGLLSAIALYMLGEKRFERFADWWSNRPLASLRAASVVAVAFGLFLYFAPVA